MTDTTIEVRGVEVDAKDVRDATAEALDEDDNVTAHAGARAGSVLVHGDGCIDADGYVIDAQTGTTGGLSNLADVRDRAESAIEPPFKEYVEDIVLTAEVTTETSCADADVDVNNGNLFARNRLQALINDEGTEVTYMSGNDVGVLDVRDE